MSRVLAVYQKEMLAYFRSPIAYFVVAVFLVGTGYFFTYNMFMSCSASMDETFRNMGILILTLLPLVSMRLFSGEYTGRTMELLMTLPLKPWEIVLGKYLGAVTILLLMTVGTFIDLIPLNLFGNPQTTTIISGYIGFFLLGMACLAVGQFFSALTQNQIVAALITVPVLLSFWFIGHLQNFQVSAVTALAAGLGVRDGVLVYPEGTRVTAAKRAKRLAELAAHGGGEGLARAERLRHVLPPRTGGPLALLAAAPAADVLVVAHTGFDDVTTFVDTLRGALIGEVVRVRWWRHAAASVPRE